MYMGTGHLLNPFVSRWTLRLCLCLGQIVQSAAGKIQELGSSSREVCPVISPRVAFSGHEVVLYVGF